MNNYQKFGLIAGQVLMGLVFAFAGMIIAALSAYLFFEVANLQLDLYSEFTYAIIGGYIGMQAGVAFEGFKLLKRNSKQNEFVRFLCQSIAGTIAALVIAFSFIVPIDQTIGTALLNFLMVALPLIGAIVGFNLGLAASIEQSDQK